MMLRKPLALLIVFGAVAEQCVHGHFVLEDMRRQLRVLFPNSLFEEWDISDWGHERRRLREQVPEWLSEEELIGIEHEGDWFPEILFLSHAGWSARLTSQGMRRRKENQITFDTSKRKPHKRGDLAAWQESWDEVYEAYDTAVDAVRTTELVWQVAALRDVFGSLFSPVRFDPAWLTWNDGTAQKIAQAIYNERAFDRMPILADALEEAGCTNSDILNHCRQQGEHVPGCWVVDMLLGKE
jgi:hypothetical protein